MVGLEPTNSGVKVRCLTTWLHPKILIQNYTLTILNKSRYWLNQVSQHQTVKSQVFSTIYNTPKTPNKARGNTLKIKTTNYMV